MKPGELVLARFRAEGISARQLAAMVGRDHSRIVRLAKPKPEGTGGQIPNALMPELLKAAKRCGVRLTAEELMVGGRR